MKFVSRGWGAKQTWWIDGKQVTKEEFDAALPDVEDCGGDGSGLIGWKPIASRALAVHPKQVEQANARAKRHGIGVEYRPDGKPVLTTRESRKKLNKLEGFHDNDGGYGD